MASDLKAAERIAIDFADAGELATKTRESAKGVRERPEWGLEVTPSAGHLPWKGSTAESRVPLSGTRITVRKHVEVLASRGTDRGGNIC